MRIAITLAILLGASSARAFPGGGQFGSPASGNGTAGGGGLFYTGAARDYGINCGSCHIKSPGLIDATVTPTPAWQMVNGAPAYQPGQTYTIIVDMLNETKGLNQGKDNLNGFNLTVEDDGGKTAGVFTSDSGQTSSSCPPSFPMPAPVGSTVLYGDCHAVVYLNVPNRTTWGFSWTAPPAGAGPLTMFYAVVDGNHRGASALDDDVKVGRAKLAEGQ